MQNITRHLNGQSPTKVTVCGHAASARQEVFRLYSYGVISGMPEELANRDEEKPLSGIVNLVCKTYPKRFESGLRTLAEIELQKEMAKPALLSGKRDIPTWQALVEEKVPQIRALFALPVKVEETEEDSE